MSKLKGKCSLKTFRNRLKTYLILQNLKWDRPIKKTEKIFVDEKDSDLSTGVRFGRKER